MKYLNKKAVTNYIHEHDRMVKPEFLARLDAHIEYLIHYACITKNGGHKKLDSGVADFHGFKRVMY